MNHNREATHNDPAGSAHLNSTFLSWSESHISSLWSKLSHPHRACFIMLSLLWILNVTHLLYDTFFFFFLLCIHYLTRQCIIPVGFLVRCGKILVWLPICFPVIRTRGDQCFIIWITGNTKMFLKEVLCK